MTVKELIAFLQTKPQDLEVVSDRYSENCLIEQSEITIQELGLARPDGWVADFRPDKPSKSYLKI